QQRVLEAAPVLIYQRLAGVLAYEPRLQQASIEELHALRIAFKRLRYTVEFFREVLGPQASGVLKAIKAMQDHLGDLNDADVACALLSRFLAEWDARQKDLPLPQRHNPQPLVAYLAVQHAERHRLMTAFPQAWENFFSPQFKRSLALAIAEL
ncbi:MAG: CHAD domain-containing protein, partial [Anaerolineae bacterium]